MHTVKMMSVNKFQSIYISISSLSSLKYFADNYCELFQIEYTVLISNIF